ncbi:MAG: hypothetical protein KF774_11350 [Planctomyces sp.]|nr:hypothetical protein [Planctomyces sp.]
MRVLLLTFNCLPRRWLGCYGSMDRSTPGLDRLASQGAVFDECITASVESGVGEACGLRTPGRGEHAIRTLDGRLLGGAHRTFRVAPAAKKRHDRPLLSSAVHETCVWFRGDAPQQACAWLRHPGIVLAEPPFYGERDERVVARQLEQLDAGIGDLLDRWQVVAEPDWRLVIVAGRGAIPAPPPRTDADARAAEVPPEPVLCDDWIHVPLLMLAGGGESFGARSRSLLSTACVGATLERWLGVESPALEPVCDLDAALTENAGLPRVVTRGPGLFRSVRTPEWFLRANPFPRVDEPPGALFRKPEDVWDVFDIATQHPETAADLATYCEPVPTIGAAAGLEETPEASPDADSA